MFRAKEMVNSSHRKMKEEEGRRIVAVDAFHVAEKSNQELKSKLTEVERGKRSVEAALDSAKRQAEGQKVLIRQVKDQLATSKEQINALKKKLKEVEKAKDQAKKAREEAEQERYDVGVVETEEALRAKVSGVCRNYCLQIWNEALNQAEVEASSVLRKVANVYYPLAIRASGPTCSRTDPAPEVAKVGRDSPAKVLTSSNNPTQVAKDPEVIEKEKNTNKGVASDATKPPTITQDFPDEKEVPNKMELVLATLPLFAKVDLARKGPEASEAASTQPIKIPPKEKIVIKKKQFLVQFSLLFFLFLFFNYCFYFQSL